MLEQVDASSIPGKISSNSMCDPLFASVGNVSFSLFLSAETSYRYHNLKSAYFFILLYSFILLFLKGTWIVNISLTEYSTHKTFGNLRVN